jgi:hypothetical protein
MHASFSTRFASGANVCRVIKKEPSSPIYPRTRYFAAPHERTAARFEVVAKFGTLVLKQRMVILAHHDRRSQRAAVRDRDSFPEAPSGGDRLGLRAAQT